MKYISTVILFILLSWTWSLATTPRDYSLELYNSIEAEFENAIRAYIKEHRPDANSVIFRQLYTEAASTNGSIRAHFRYEIEAPAGGGESTSETLEGIALRHSPDEGKTWVWNIEEVIAPSIRFHEGIKITPSKEPAE
jgi:hypothetical protein